MNGNYFKLTTSRVPTAPGKPGKMTSFSSPGKVLEFYNFIKNPGKMNCLGKNSFDCCNIHFYCIGLCPLKCTFGRNPEIVGLLWCFQMAGYMGQLGLACSWIPRREIDPQLLVAPSVRLVLTAFTTDSPCLGGQGRVNLGRETRVSHLVSV